MIAYELLVTNSVVGGKFGIACSQERIMLFDNRVESGLELVNVDRLFIFKHLRQGAVADVYCPWFAPIADSISPDKMRKLRSCLFDPSSDVLQQFFIIFFLEHIAHSISELHVRRADSE
jgi:hypothetical protein